MEDILRTFDNAMLYNPVASGVHHIASHLRRTFISILDLNPHRHRREIYCQICLDGERKHDHRIAFHCDECDADIPWGTPCWSDARQSYHLCEICYRRTHRTDLVQFPNNCVQKETWVRCTKCAQHFHEVCAMINTKAGGSPFVCPSCPREPGGTRERISVEDILPHTPLSRVMEAAVRQFTTPVTPSTVWVRQLSIQRIVTEVSEEIRVARGISIGSPKAFPATRRCLGFFQTLDGVDVLLMVMYTIEYGRDCPPPNTDKVYISYIDSVRYFRPHGLRRQAYHCFIGAYMDVMRHVGFKSVHLWSAPPSNGVQYIFLGHPKPSPPSDHTWLREWYKSMFQAAITANIARAYHQQDFSQPDAVPCFEDDLWMRTGADIALSQQDAIVCILNEVTNVQPRSLIEVGETCDILKVGYASLP